MLYEYDAGVDKGTPGAVVFPSDTQDVAKIVRIACAEGVSIVPRGAGTGLSGGSIARDGGIVLVFTRMNKILEIDLENQRAVVQPGVVNLDLTSAVEREGFYFAPDPSSQKACTIGGNVAENSGGPHTLAHGVTVNHVTGIEVVLGDGRIAQFGGKCIDGCGYDMTGFFTGTEGTVGIVTAVTVKLTRKAESVATLLAIFDTIDDGANSVVDITREGITPTALEMLDGLTLRTVEEATHAGYPMDAGAVLLIELEGLREAVEEQAEAIRQRMHEERRPGSPSCQERSRASATLEGQKKCFRCHRSLWPLLITRKMAWFPAPKSRKHFGTLQPSARSTA